jgi:hypothetical protein
MSFRENIRNEKESNRMFCIQLDSFANSSFVNPRRWLNAVSQPRSTRWVFAEAFLPSSITNIEA